MKIRKATIKDLKKIQELNLELFKKEHKEFDKTLNCKWTFGKKGTSYFKERIEKDGLALVAEVDGKIVGYLVGGKAEVKSYRTATSICELENMMILEKYRNLKIGTKLVEEFLKWTEQKKFEIIEVSASSKNLKGIDFYKKMGFEEYSITLEKRM